MLSIFAQSSGFLTYFLFHQTISKKQSIRTIHQTFLVFPTTNNFLVKVILVCMYRVHRRKNEEIPKDYICTQGCGKAYGSQAALYTHMKNKHGCSKSIILPKYSDMQRQRKTGKKGRPITKQKDINLTPIKISQSMCKLCFQEDCLCDSSINEQEIAEKIAIMQDRNFLRILNSIANLHIEQSFTWIRSSEQQCQVLTDQQLKKLVQNINPMNSIDEKWGHYLRRLSVFLDPKLINEIYRYILIIITNKSQNQQQLDMHLDFEHEFKNIRRCKHSKKKEWTQFIQALKNI